MSRTLYMSVVEKPHPQAAILQSDKSTTPVMKGNADVNLACGSCQVVLAQGLTVEWFANQFQTPFQLLLRCPKCAAYNRLPATLGP
ncbi:hypothetical protein [Phenylobacterium sp.]|uniref:hypothetical protein n=1 Tax=Phenylobacterium sp. TaxID=1871053 RepID=UPI0035B23C48